MFRYLLSDVLVIRRAPGPACQIPDNGFSILGFLDFLGLSILGLSILGLSILGFLDYRFLDYRLIDDRFAVMYYHLDNM